MTKNLFLDDERNPADVTWIDIGTGPWDIVRTQEQFEDYLLANGMPDRISFDNDLGDGMGEGIFCVHWLVDAVLDGQVTWNPNFTFTVHSKNPVAAKSITALLNNFIKFQAS